MALKLLLYQLLLVSLVLICLLIHVGWLDDRRVAPQMPPKLGRGNLCANGHPGGQPWRQLQCVSCHGYVYETHDTIFHGQRSSVDLIARVIACLAEGLGIRDPARVFEIDPNTVLQWWVQAAEQIQAFSA